ncbi:2,3,4,5-tetrahydropyridine-2,6-dicarboxylate N-succinyltransferase [Gammaproteobacteria bacterium]|nr:2,3,4,5-tetrahydropyridine-2,6-dicarboxylate N-succinyltransferase [Gammaproteobacteria bacterium]
MQDLAKVIETAFELGEKLSPVNVEQEVLEAIVESINLLDQGKIRVAAPTSYGWKVNEWVKKAVLLSFKFSENQTIPGSHTNYFDKVQSKFKNMGTPEFKKIGARVVPPAEVRHGSFIGENVVLMPSYVNIGAYVGSGTMVDTWATVGSCAQIGKNVHLSGGVGIGGVLEPLQATPTIIEDGCFIGARSEIVEGVIIGAGAVISMGVYIGQSTKIYDRETGEVSFGKVPKGSVVVPGNLPSDDGKYSLYCAVIVKKVDEKTRQKTAINELLRGI